MVTDVDEFNRARALIDRELERARLLALPHAAPDTCRRHAGSAGTGVHAAANLAQRRFRLDRLERSVCSSCSPWTAPIRASRGVTTRSSPAVAYARPANRAERGRSQWRSFAVRRNGGTPLEAMALIGAGPAQPVDAARQYRAREDDDPQSRHARDHRFHRPAMRSQRPQPAHAAYGLRSRTRCGDQAIERSLPVAEWPGGP